jgi:two-component system, cell cycle response regulator DivK
VRATDVSGIVPRPVICLVDDHQDTREMYKEFLSVSFEVMAAADGARALELMRTSPPDLLITDLSLPGIDGFELIALVRKDPALRHTPIICLSGYGGPDHEQRALEAGCDRILQKPYLPDALAAIALDVMRSVRSRGIESS